MIDRITIRHRTFGPHIIAVAQFFDAAITPMDTIEELNRGWPRFSFADFVGACGRSEALAMQQTG